MASNKNQHFVPRCYLKPFSFMEEGKAINLYNIDRRRGIRNAPVKNQCAADYFYGENLELEKSLQPIEGMYAKALRDVARPRYVLNEGDKTVLVHFCYLQHCRTEATARQAAMSMAEVARIAGDERVTSWRSIMRDAVLGGMHGFADTMSTVYDLKACLIRNRTGFPFITSDDPVVMTNRWYQQKSKTAAAQNSGGAGNAGVLFFMPLRPDILLILYDGDVYNIQNEDGWVTLTKSADVEAFNEHQVLRCVANI